MENTTHNSQYLSDVNLISESRLSPDWGLEDVVDQLREARRAWRDNVSLERASIQDLPSREALQSIVTRVCRALYPKRLGPKDLHNGSEDFYVGHTLNAVFNDLLKQVMLELCYSASHSAPPFSELELRCLAIDIVRQFASALPDVRKSLDKDVLAAFHGDPAARTVDEILLCYPGTTAILYHRIAHTLYRLGVPLLARMVSEQAHSATGIDIHPGAQIGDSFFIDHGTGVVIGETAVIGNRVRLYQAVTLGAKSFPTDEAGNLQKGLPRHPIVEDDVVIYAGATVLGRITIGKGAVIGGNTWITRDVRPKSHISQTSLKQDELSLHQKVVI